MLLLLPRPVPKMFLRRRLSVLVAMMMWTFGRPIIAPDFKDRPLPLSYKTHLPWFYTILEDPMQTLEASLRAFKGNGRP